MLLGLDQLLNLLPLAKLPSGLRHQQTQLPLLSLQSVTTTFDEFTGIINVSTVYDLPNNTQVETVIGIAYIQGTNPIYQETL